MKDVRRTARVTVWLVATVVALAGVPATGRALAAKLTAGDGAADDNFGAGLSLSGGFILVGSLYDDDLGDASGSAYVFERDRGGPGAWGLVTKLTASDGTTGDEFGFPVAIAGDLALVSARFEDDHGAAYLFGRDEGGPDAWGEIAKLTAADGAADDRFGRAVAIGPQLAVVGAPRDDDGGDRSGSAYVFGRNEGGADQWGFVAKLTAPDAAAGDEFGAAVALSGDLVIVGSHGDDDRDENSGSAYVFGRNEGGLDQWGFIAKLTADDGDAGDDLGYFVSLDGDLAVAGARRGDGLEPGAGAVYVFARDEGGPDQWGQRAKLVALDGEDGDSFGVSVLSGDLIIVGAIGQDDGGENAGCAYLFARDRGGADQWGQVARLTAFDGEAHDQFGFPVALSGHTAAVTAYQDDDEGDNSGSVYVFDTVEADSDVTNLRAVDSVGTYFEWDPMPGGSGVVYDVVRGELASVSGDAGGVDLEFLTCIADDLQDTSNQAFPDTDVLPPGAVFFYVVRFQDGPLIGPWGFGSEGGERAGTGGCGP